MLLLHTHRTCDESHYYKRIYFQEDNVCSFYTLAERAYTFDESQKRSMSLETCAVPVMTINKQLEGCHHCVLIRPQVTASLPSGSTSETRRSMSLWMSFWDKTSL